MATKIDTAGTYRGEVTEAAFQLSRNGFPQFVVRLTATERYISEKSDLDFYVGNGTIEEAEPQWLDWSGMDENITAYMILYGNKDGTGEFNTTNVTSSYKQIQSALGWDGKNFDDLRNNKFVGDIVLFRVADSDNEKYPGMKVVWFDKKDAPPTRELRNVADSELTDLNKKLARGMGFKKNAAVAAPAPAKSV